MSTLGLFCRDETRGSGQVMAVDLPSSGTVDDVRAACASILDIPAGELVVLFCGEELLPATTLADSGLSAEVEVQIRWNRMPTYARGKRVRPSPSLPLTSLACSATGSRLFTGGYDRQLRVVNAERMEEEQAVSGHNNVLYAIAAHPTDDSVVATGGFDKVVLVHRLGQRDVSTQKLATHLSEVIALEMHDGGAKVISGGMDNAACIADLGAASTVTTLTGHQGEVPSVVSCGPDLIATASFDHTARVWDVRSAKTVHVIEGHQGELACISYSPQLQSVAVASVDRQASVWDLRAGKRTAKLVHHTDENLYCSFSPADGRRLLVASADHTASVWEAATGRQLSVLTGHAGEIPWAAWHPTGSCIATGSSDKTAAVYDPLKSEPAQTFTCAKDELFRIHFSPDGNTMYTASKDNVVYSYQAV